MNAAHVSQWLARMVRERARHRCEYCLTPQVTEDAVFHIDHVTPKASKGTSEFENLALACVTCSLKKGMRTGGIDPNSNVRAAFFNPRRNRWDDHFQFGLGWTVVGKTATGRVTVAALDLNREKKLRLRLQYAFLDLFPDYDRE